ITVKATGDLTIKGVTKPTTIDIDATLQNGVLVLVGSAPVAFADFGITAPTAPVVASVEDRGVMEFQLYLTKA
ncbi:MAG: YceI family protein, partial [Acidimicrobiales bacterium]